jgi:hypothetical protein
MAAEIFTHEWASLWADSINANASYKQAAATWEGAIGMIMTADSAMGIPAERIVIADLWHGDCRGARAATAAELEETPYLISAEPAAWRSVLDEVGEELAPLLLRDGDRAEAGEPDLVGRLEDVLLQLLAPLLGGHGGPPCRCGVPAPLIVVVPLCGIRCQL